MFDTTKTIEGVIANGTSVGLKASVNLVETLAQLLNRTITDLNDENGDIKTLYSQGTIITFSNCYYLSRINLPSCSVLSSNNTNVTNMFYNCYNLKEINIPLISNIYTMTSCFYRCSSLESMTANFTSTIIGDMSNAFVNCGNLKEVHFPLVSYANKMQNTFSGCTSLETIDMPLVTTISYLASTFYNCYSLKNVLFPNCSAMYSVGSTFINCSALESVKFDSLKLISAYGTGFFYGCYNFKRLDLPAITNFNINYGAFSGCSSFSEFIVRTSNCSLGYTGTKVFANCPITLSSFLGYYGSIYVPDEYVDAYKASTNWVTVSDRITGISNLPENKTHQ